MSGFVVEDGDTSTYSSIISNGPFTVTSSAADYVFTVDETNVSAGKPILMYVQMILTESTGTNINAVIDKITVDLDRKVV